MSRFAPPASLSSSTVSLPSTRFAWEVVRRGAHFVSPRFTELAPALGSGNASVTESPVVTAAPFERVVVSWNGTGTARIELRALVGKQWTPYLPLAVLTGTVHRSATRAELAAAHSSVAASLSLPFLARVETDTFVLPSGALATAFQVRVVGTIPANRQPLADLRSLCVTHYRVADRKWTDRPADARAWEMVLPVPTRSQRDCEDPAIRPEVCSPTSLSMVLDYHKTPRRTIEVCREVFDSNARIYGNWPANTATASRLLGTGSWSTVVKMTGWDEVEREIAQGRPVILSHRWNRGELTGAPVSRSLGHLIVCVGFTKTGDVVVNDPAAPASAVRRVYDRAELFRTWQERGEGIAYVIRPA